MYTKKYLFYTHKNREMLYSKAFKIFYTYKSVKKKEKSAGNYMFLIEKEVYIQKTHIEMFIIFHYNIS